ncbi:phosphatidylinositol transfer protein 1-like isoform X1 [Zophobas morio]|uniref:phosphatidylinositol transfer protein 1-like isoform X1 n=1 Tax=Zophobas morio TaxID=2755281 RepID=UPI003082EE3E
MLLVEYRIPLPFTLEEFEIAQLYMVVKASQEYTVDGEGVEIIKNEPYNNLEGALDFGELSKVSIPKNKGQYTHKKYYIGSRIPPYVKAVLPCNALYLNEEAWNAYPYCKTALTNGYLDTAKFHVEIESLHFNDKGQQENIFNLKEEELLKRKVIHLDISEDLSKSSEYNDKYDPRKFKSKKTGRGLLSKGWEISANPVMCAYKLVRINFRYFGMQNKVEKIIEDYETRLFLSTLRQAFCLIDEWYALDMHAIRDLEEQVEASGTVSRACTNPPAFLL